MENIDKEHTAALKAQLTHYFKGDQWAVQLCLDLFTTAQVWDDLIDKDKPVNNDAINAAFFIALINIPANPFYREYGAHLRPLILNAILRWKDANKLEHGSLSDQHQAFIHRAAIYDIFVMCAYLIGGVKWAEEVGPEMRQLYGEKFENFAKEMNDA